MKIKQKCLCELIGICQKEWNTKQQREFAALPWTQKVGDFFIGIFRFNKKN